MARTRKRTVLVEMPSTPYEWEPARIGRPGYNIAISGTHNALYAIAKKFAASGWLVYLAGLSIRGPPLPSMVHVDDSNVSQTVQDPLDLTIIATSFQMDFIKQERAPTGYMRKMMARHPWTMVGETRALVVVMENQILYNQECQLLYAYLRPRQRRLGGKGDTSLTFVHLSEWTRKVFEANLAGRIVQDVRAPTDPVLVYGLKPLKRTCKWVSDARWVRHETRAFSNPVDVETIARAKADNRQRRKSRNTRSLIYPACWERGCFETAAVFARLKDEWGPKARATFAYYDPSSTNGPEMRKCMKRAANGNDMTNSSFYSSINRFFYKPLGTDHRVTAGIFGKKALMAKMHESGYFVYGLVSTRGLVHYDTFANVVAESLAAGVIVLAPRIAALPYLYTGAVVFVDPPHGLSPTNANCTFMCQDTSGLGSDAMVGAFVRRIQQIEANPCLARKLRLRGKQFVKARFAEAVVTGRLYQHLIDPPHLIDWCRAGIIKRDIW